MAAEVAQPEWQMVGEQFVTFYYQTFDTNRTGIAALYEAESMLTFEGQQFMGPDAIAEKLVSLAFQTVSHQVTTVDCQPSPGNGVVIFVIGQLLTDNEEHPMSFSQVFHLQQNASGAYFCFNDIFRLNVHSS